MLCAKKNATAVCVTAACLLSFTSASVLPVDAIVTISIPTTIDDEPVTATDKLTI